MTVWSRNVLVVSIGLLAASAGFSATQIDLTAAKRSDALSFNVAGNINGENPTVLSELRWSDIDVTHLAATITHDITPSVFLEGQLGYGWINDGTNRDSDYNGDNREGEFSRSYSDVAGDHVQDSSLAVGYRFKSVNILGGYADNRQSLRDINLVQVIPDIGPIPGENTTYDAKWRGPWLGIAGEKALNKRLTVNARAQYHWTSFDSTADWNLREDFAHPVSFRQSGDGNGTTLTLGADYRLSNRWHADLSVQVADFKVKNGRDTVYFADGLSSTTRLNEADWHAKSLMLQGTYQF